jgi:hypothetical protein
MFTVAGSHSRTFSDFRFQTLALSLHPAGSEGGSTGGFGGDAVGGGAGGPPDKMGRNSSGMKLAQTS